MLTSLVQVLTLFPKKSPPDGSYSSLLFSEKLALAPYNTFLGSVKKAKHTAQ